jgi:hypothetical protein
MGRLYTGRKTQITWIMLPQGFKNSPTFFRESLSANLSTLPEENASFTLLQYIDNLLLTNHNWEKCYEGTKALLD